MLFTTSHRYSYLFNADKLVEVKDVNHTEHVEPSDQLGKLAKRDESGTFHLPNWRESRWKDNVPIVHKSLKIEMKWIVLLQLFQLKCSSSYIAMT